MGKRKGEGLETDRLTGAIGVTCRGHSKPREEGRTELQRSERPSRERRKKKQVVFPLLVFVKTPPGSV